MERTDFGRIHSSTRNGCIKYHDNLSFGRRSSHETLLVASPSDKDNPASVHGCKQSRQSGEFWCHPTARILLLPTVMGHSPPISMFPGMRTVLMRIPLERPGPASSNCRPAARRRMRALRLPGFVIARAPAHDVVDSRGPITPNLMIAILVVEDKFQPQRKSQCVGLVLLVRTGQDNFILLCPDHLKFKDLRSSHTSRWLVEPQDQPSTFVNQPYDMGILSTGPSEIVK